MDYLVIGADGKEYGPVNLATLAEWAKDDRVRPNSTLKECASGRSLTGAQVPGLFTPLAAPAPGAEGGWSQPPNYYNRPGEPQKVYVQGVDPGRYILWAFLDAFLAILFVLMWRSIGPIVFCAFSFYNSIRSVLLKHKLCWAALAASVVALAVVVVVIIVHGTAAL